MSQIVGKKVREIIDLVVTHGNAHVGESFLLTILLHVDFNKLNDAVVVLDINMPYQGGIETAVKIMSNYSEDDPPNMPCGDQVT